MKTWSKAVLVNGAAIVGLAISLLIVPGSTPFWIWSTASVVVLAVLNYAMVIRKDSKKTGNARTRTETTIVIIVGAALLLFDLILRYRR